VKKYLVPGIIVMLLVAAAPSSAGPFADDMAKCLVRATTPADKSALVQWMFATMSLHPEVKQFAQVTADQRATLNKRFGDLIVALLTERCATESKTALKNEGMSVIESSFNLLGQVAAQELFSHADVASGLADFGKLVDAEKLKKLLDDVK
jgi:hypothetical protein